MRIINNSKKEKSLFEIFNSFLNPIEFDEHKRIENNNDLKRKGTFILPRSHVSNFGPNFWTILNT